MFIYLQWYHCRAGYHSTSLIQHDQAELQKYVSIGFSTEFIPRINQRLARKPGKLASAKLSPAVTGQFLAPQQKKWWISAINMLSL